MTKSQKRLNIQMPAAMYAQIEMQAKDGRTMADIVRAALDEFLAPSEESDKVQELQAEIKYLREQLQLLIRLTREMASTPVSDLERENSLHRVANSRLREEALHQGTYYLKRDSEPAEEGEVRCAYSDASFESTLIGPTSHDRPPEFCARMTHGRTVCCVILAHKAPGTIRHLNSTHVSNGHIRQSSRVPG